MRFSHRPPPKREVLTPSSASHRRREAAKRETRAALIAAARACFSEEGLDKPSLDAICSRAGYTRGALYIHFTDRDALIEAVIEDQLTQLVDGVAFGEAEQAVPRLTSALNSGGVPALQLLNAAARSTAIKGRLLEALEGVAQQLEPASADVPLGVSGRDLLAQALGAALLQELGFGGQSGTGAG